MRRGNKLSRTGVAIALLSTAAALVGCGGGASSGGAGGSGPAAGDPTVSATVTGLTGQGLVLELNGAQDLPVATDGTVTFPSGLTTGAQYSVTVATQPAVRREICDVSNGSGTIGQANVTNVAINCSIVVGFLYQTTFSNHLFSYRISAGTGAPVSFGAPLTTGTNPTSLVAAPGGRFLYVTTPIDEGAAGFGSISVYAVNSDSGALTAVSSVVTTGLNPTRLALSPGGAFLFALGGYSVSGSAVASYAVDATTGALTPTGTFVTLGAVWAPSLAVRADGKFLYILAGNFSNITPSPATLTAYAIDPASGALTAGPALTWMTSLNNPTSPAMALDPLGRFLYLASEQGDTNQAAATVLPYAIDPVSGALTAIGTGTPVTSNADQMTVDPSGRYLYVINSLNSDAANDTVLALAIDQSSGAVSPLGSPLETPSAPQAVICDPSGQFVYVGMLESSSPANLAGFAISTAGSTAGQLLPSGLSGVSEESMALAIVE